MGYRIDYGPAVPEKFARTGSNRRFRTMIAAALLAFSLSVRLAWPEGTAVLREIFLPVNLTATEVAFSELLLELRQGEPISNSVTAFCQKILNEDT